MTDEAKDALELKVAAMQSEINSLKEVLLWYFENDATEEGGTWEIYNAASLRIKRKAKALLGMDNT